MSLHGQQHKILFAGPVGAGKTTAIAAVSETGVAQTESKASDDVMARKATTTVAMDYGSIKADDRHSIRLIGTPGQVRFSFMWEILSEGAIGLVLLIDMARPDPIADLLEYLAHFKFFMDRPGTALVVALTRTDLSNAVDRRHVLKTLEARNLRVPVLEMDARERADVREVLLVLTAVLESKARGH